uniref:Uncharacterized protein n=1 Tax=Rhizophora mucronata TaxID=61149 RepID=A0A2P2J1C6_RHIMU
MRKAYDAYSCDIERNGTYWHRQLHQAQKGEVRQAVCHWGACQHVQRKPLGNLPVMTTECFGSRRQQLCYGELWRRRIQRSDRTASGEA